MAHKNTRRDFMIKAGAGALAISSLSSFKLEDSARPVKSPIKTGVAGYTFVKIGLDDALDMMQKVDAKYLSIKNFHLPFDSTAEQIKEFRNKLAEHGVDGYSVGPIYMKSEKEIDDAFEYAKRVGTTLLIGVPNYELLPYTEKKVKEYNIRLAIHNHGPDNLLYPTASFIMEKIGKMDSRMGICLDIGHNQRSGEDPAAAISKYHARIFDMHIKDVTEASKAGKNVEVGRGIIDIPAVFKAISKVNYAGVCSLEYEKDQTEPLVGIAESMGYIRGVVDSVG